jgi:hypothetical protein
MAATRALSTTPSKPNENDALATRLSGILHHTLAVDDEFVQQHMKVFAGREYVKYEEVCGFIAAGKALRKKIENRPNNAAYEDTLRIEINGFAVWIRNTIGDYKAECDKRRDEVFQVTRNHYNSVYQQKKKIVLYQRADEADHPVLSAEFNALINAYKSDIENMHAQREVYSVSMYEDNMRMNPSLKEILARIFYINHFERSFLSHDDKFQKHEDSLKEAYKNIVTNLIIKFREQILKQQMIHQHFISTFDKHNAINLDAMLKVLQEQLHLITDNANDSIDDWREKLFTIKKLQKDYQTYFIAFCKAEQLRRIRSSSHNTAQTMLALIEKEIILSTKNYDHTTILTALKDALTSSIQFYINGRSYKGIRTDQTPLQLDAYFTKHILDQTYISLITCLQTNHIEDSAVITWAKSFLLNIQSTKPSSQSSTASVSSIEVDHERDAFSFQQQLKEKMLDVLVAKFTEQLYPTTSNQYSLWSIWRSTAPTKEQVSLLIGLQCMIADKSESNLKQIVQLTTQHAASVHLQDVLQQISATANEILAMPIQPAVQANRGVR